MSVATWATRIHVNSRLNCAHDRDAMNTVLLTPVPNRRLARTDPLQTCIPLEPLTGYEPVFASAERDVNSGRSAVQIFRRAR